MDTIKEENVEVNTETERAEEKSAEELKESEENKREEIEDGSESESDSSDFPDTHIKVNYF